MWPYLVGIQLFNSLHRPARDELLSRLGAAPVLDNVWLIYGDYSIDVLQLALRTILSDWDMFFIAAIDEEFAGQNVPVRKI